MRRSFNRLIHRHELISANSFAFLPSRTNKVTCEMLQDWFDAN